MSATIDPSAPILNTVGCFVSVCGGLDCRRMFPSVRLKELKASLRLASGLLTSLVLLWIPLCSNAQSGNGQPGKPGEVVQEAFDPNHPYFTMGEIYKVFEKSERSYEVKPYEDEKGLRVEDFLKLYFPIRHEHLNYPKVIEDPSKPGQVTVTEFEIDPKAKEASDEGEPFFMRGNCDEAIKHYQEAISISKDFYPAYLNLGDCYLKAQPETALKYYERAREINPFDYKVHFFAATAYLKLSRIEDAKKSYIKALTLRPRYGMIMASLTQAKDLLGVEVYEERFAPKAVAVEKEGKILIYISDEEQGAWTPYAFAKALWLGEPEYRRKYLGTDEKTWTVKEELLSMMTMLDMYKSMETEKKIRPIPYFERMIEILKNGDLGTFVIYEIGPNVSADIVLSLPESVRAEVQGYVEKYLVVEKK